MRCAIRRPDDVDTDQDRGTFERQFTESIQNRTDLLTYVRLRCKSEHDVYGPNIPVLPVMPSGQDGEPAVQQSPKPPSKEILFEIKGYPHFVVSSTLGQQSSNRFEVGDLQAMDSQPGPSNSVPQSGTSGLFKCFFLMAKPYPSRNTAM
jgi:hypothetical protein